MEIDKAFDTFRENMERIDREHAARLTKIRRQQLLMIGVITLVILAPIIVVLAVRIR